MSAQEMPPPLVLLRMISGFYVSQAIYIMARLGIADHLSDGPLDAEELAKRSKVHAPSLRRVLRLLVTAEVLSEDDKGRFALTPIGDCLRAGVLGSMRPAALLFGGITERAWGDLLYSVETGEPAFRRVFGKDSFAYLAEHPEEAANFDAAMSAFTEPISTVVAAAYDFSQVRHVVDVGGGNGALLVGVLKAHPALKGTLFDLPQVVERARPRLRELGIADRCDTVGGDFIAAVPHGADVYLLKHVIHDWNDDRAAAILHNCRKAMSPAAKLLIVEGVYPPRLDQSDASRRAAANDVNMLVCTGGRQRSEAEFRSLYAAAGLALSRIKRPICLTLPSSKVCRNKVNIVASAGFPGTESAGRNQEGAKLHDIRLCDNEKRLGRTGQGDVASISTTTDSPSRRTSAGKLATDIVGGFVTSHQPVSAATSLIASAAIVRLDGAYRRFRYRPLHRTFVEELGEPSGFHGRSKDAVADAFRRALVRDGDPEPTCACGGFIPTAAS